MNHIVETIKILLHNQELIVNSNPHVRDVIHRVQFNYQYKTVGVLSGRMTGKSRAIGEMYRPGDMIIVPTENMKLIYPRNFNVCTPMELHCRRGKPLLKKSYIFIDECTFIDELGMQEIYGRTDADWYVKVGT